MTAAQDVVTMRWLSYVPGKSTLLLLFKAARVRLMANSENVTSLPDARIASATEEINRISDDIRDAKAGRSLYSPNTMAHASVPADTEVEFSSPVAASTVLKRGNSRAPDKARRPGQFTIKDLSADVGASAGVQWAGEYDALAGRREKGAFVSQLVALGYNPHDFRVTVRRVPSEGPDDARQRYTVQVAQLRNGMPYRDKRYVGGHGSEWVTDFSRDAATAFPRNVDPSPACVDRQPPA